MFVGKRETGREADRLGTVGIGGCVRSQVNGTSHKAACTRSRARVNVQKREPEERVDGGASGVAAAAAAGAAKANRGEGGMHTTS